MITGPEVDITTPNRPAEHEQRVRTVVAVVTNDHAWVVAGKQGEVERVDVERTHFSQTWTSVPSAFRWLRTLM